MNMLSMCTSHSRRSEEVKTWNI